jgi:hypothetical protein
MINCLVCAMKAILHRYEMGSYVDKQEGTKMKLGFSMT